MSSLPTVVETAHGPLNLPVYFPDATRGVVRAIDSRDLEACSIRGLVVNVFHLSTHPGVGLIKRAGGIHRFMDWTQPIASDSGGFQLMSMIRQNPKYGTITDRGIHFVDIDGKRDKLIFTPERSIRQQFDLGADLMVCLDDCPAVESSPEEVEISVGRTIHWAKRCRAEFDRLLKSRAKRQSPRPLLFGVIQGGYDKSTRSWCAEQLLQLGFDGFGFGGWPLTPDGMLAKDILAHTAQLVPDHLPKFALGVGKPEHIVSCYKMGWRIFDCVLPTRDARHGRLYAFSALEPTNVDLRSSDFYQFAYIRDEKHKRNYGPISEICDCACCTSYSVSYLHHLFDIGDALSLRLATQHNLRFYTMLMDYIRASQI